MAAANTLQDIRRQNLKKWVEQSGSSLTNVAMRLGHRSGISYLSQLIRSNSGTSFGEKTARSLEQKLGLAPFFFDRKPGEAIPFKNTDNVLLISVIGAVGDALKAAGISNPPSDKFADLVALVYEHAASTSGKIDPQYLARLIKLLG